MPRSNKTNKADYSREQGARRTYNAPKVQDANPVRTPPQSEADMSLEEFMRRNPSARDVDAIKNAQADQGKRSGPKTRPTSRSKRKNPRRPRPTQGVIERAARAEQAIDPMKWNVNKVEVAGDEVDFLTPTNPALGRGPLAGQAPQVYGGPNLNRDIPGHRDMSDEEFTSAYKEAVAKGRAKHKMKGAKELFRKSFER